MKKFYSKVDPTILLHIIIRREDFLKGRFDVIDPDQFLQCSIMLHDKGTTFTPHKHKWKKATKKTIAQESWVILTGSVKCIFYDLDGSVIAQPVLQSGDASFTLQGGHNYLILEDNTKVLEYKTGPYQGQSLDKTFNLNES